MCMLSSYHQHYPTFCFTEDLREATYHCIHLLGCYRLPVLAQMKTLTIYHVSDLLRTHPSIGCGKAINYGFLDFHVSKLAIFRNKKNLTIYAEKYFLSQVVKKQRHLCSYKIEEYVHF